MVSAIPEHSLLQSRQADEQEPLRSGEGAQGEVRPTDAELSASGVERTSLYHDVEEKKTDPPTPTADLSADSDNSLSVDEFSSRDVHHFSDQPQRSTWAFQHPPSMDHQRSNSERTHRNTRSWTDQRAPEPFSSPGVSRKKKFTSPTQKNKYGYGDFFRSGGAGCTGGDDVGGSRSFHLARKRAPTVRQPSFTKSDFPALSPQPIKPKQQAESIFHQRTESWSAVVGGSEEKDLIAATEDTAASVNVIDTDKILPLPFCNVPQQGDAKDEEEMVIAEGSPSSPIQSSRTYWQQIQRRRSHSFHHFSSDSFSYGQSRDNFTTMSISALQNDIGTLFARSNRVEEAIERYQLAIESAKSVLEGQQNQRDSISEEENSGGKCPKVTEAEGLAWFRQKLLRGDMAPAPVHETCVESPEANPSNDSSTLPLPFQPAGFGGCAMQSTRRLRSASLSVDDLCPPTRQRSMTFIGDEAPQSPTVQQGSTPFSSCPVTAPQPVKPVMCARVRSGSFHRHSQIGGLDDIVHDIHQHQKLDCPDEVYSCNGLTPLGLEYICDPLPILGSSLRRLISDTESKTALIESAALIAARLNLASLEYRADGGGISDKLQHRLQILESAIEDCCAAVKLIENISSEWKGRCSAVFFLLQAIAHSNTGAVQYRLKKVREAMVSFEAAKAALAGAETSHEDQIDFDFSSQSESIEPHDDNRFPQRNYLLLVVRLNLSRTSLTMNKPDEAAKYCKLINEDNKPHRRNISRRSLYGPGYHRGFRRSNSFSAASSALETAIAAYDHDIDRRSKWLCSVAEHYITGLIHEAKGEPSDYKEAWHHYNRLLSLARVKLDHRHPYICALLERRGAVLFQQRKLQCSLLSYLACLKILEHQQTNGSNVFNRADLSRILYAVARVLHDKEEYHDALTMYQRALECQRALAAVSGRPSLDVITTLCNISRVHHLSGEIDAALAANREVLELATILVGGNMEHPFLIHRLKVEGNILVEAGRLEDAMRAFVEAARRCGEDAMIWAAGGGNSTGSSQEDADAGDSSVLSIRSAIALAQMNVFHPAAPSA